MSHIYPDTHHDVSSNTIFGFWIYLMTDFIVFATLFAAYAVLNRGGASDYALLDTRFALTETLILLISSFTCGAAMVGAKHCHIRKIVACLAATFLLGSFFIWLQSFEFYRLIAGGHTWEQNAFLSSYFTLIGVHSLHILVGLILMVVFVAQLLLWGVTSVTLRRLTCFRIYWQFLYFLWIFTFAFVYLMGDTL